MNTDYNKDPSIKINLVIFDDLVGFILCSKSEGEELEEKFETSDEKSCEEISNAETVVTTDTELEIKRIMHAVVDVSLSLDESSDSQSLSTPREGDNSTGITQLSDTSASKNIKRKGHSKNPMKESESSKQSAKSMSPVVHALKTTETVKAGAGLTGPVVNGDPQQSRLLSKEAAKRQKNDPVMEELLAKAEYVVTIY